MQGTYNLWLVVASFVVATMASFTALQLANRVAASSGRAAWLWVAAGAIAMGIGVWSMHFIAMLAFSLPIPLVYNVSLTLLSVLPAMLSAALVFILINRGGLRGWRVLLPAALLGGGIAAMHYTGMAAIEIAPGIAYRLPWFIVSIVVAITVAYVALRVSFSLSAERSHWKKAVAALVMGTAVCAMHFSGMAAAHFAPGSICLSTPQGLSDAWLGALVAFNAIVILIGLLGLAIHDARFADENARMLSALRIANDELADYQAVQEEEKHVAKHLIDRLTRTNDKIGSAVQCSLTAARYFSGDMVAVAETPSRTLHILLADGTGHGLAAALGALPVVQPFYAMSAKGFGIASIAREINSKVRALLPTGRFVATTLVSVDPLLGVIGIWNGGNPACHLIDEDGRSLQRFSSAHVALGILDDHEFDARVEYCRFDRPCDLVMVSDGLIEAQNRRKEVFGEHGMLEVLRLASRSVRVRALRAALQGHVDYNQPADDVSIVVVPCTPVGSSRGMAEEAAVLEGATEKRGSRLHLVLSARELKRMEVVPALCNQLQDLGLTGTRGSSVFLVLNELFNNALDHGLLRMDRGPITRAPESVLAERARRLAMLDQGFIEITAECVRQGDRNVLRLSVKGSGDAWDFRNEIAEAGDATGTSGRGALVRSICSLIEFRDEGREIEVHVPLAA